MGVLRRLMSRRAPLGAVLLYHRIAEADVDPWGLCTSPVHFDEHLQVLREQWLPVTLPELARQLGKPGRARPAVALTFDDGYADNATVALPLLERHDIPATFFLTTRWMEQKGEFWWDELERVLLQPGFLPPALTIAIDGQTEVWELGESRYYSAAAAHRDRSWRAGEVPPTERHAAYYAIWRRLYPLPAARREAALASLLDSAGVGRAPRATHRPLTREEIAALPREGLVEVGAHTVNHQPLSRLPLAEQEREIRQGKAELEEVTGVPVTSFAYPHGDYAHETILLVREAGFSRGCSSDPHLVERRSDPFELPRIPVGDQGGDEFAKRLQSAWRERAQS